MKIYVVKNNDPIGILEEDKLGIHFNYLDDINKSHYLLGIKKQRNTSMTLFPIFENLLPEHEQLQLIKSKYGVKGLIEPLLYLDNIHGSFEFYSQEDFKSFRAVSADVFFFSENKEQILEQNYTYPNILDDYTIDIDDDKIYPVGLYGSKAIGISGYQYKFSVSVDKDTKVISHNEENGDYIMKPYNTENLIYDSGDTSTYIPHLLVNEHIFMTLARDFGFSIPYNAIIKHKEDYLYIIKRFDRYKGRKIDHHEILTLIGKNSSAKYHISALKAMKKAAEYLNQDEMLELFRFFVFSVIISHGDLHAKNISLIYKSSAIDEKSMTLAPYYDISTTKFYKDISKDDIGMAIKNKKTNIKSEDLLWLADNFDINHVVARGIIEEIGLKFLNTFENYINLLPRNIKALKIITNRFGYSRPFEETLKKYYTQRVSYLKKYMQVELKEDKKNIWE